MQKLIIYWVRRDFRLNDNPALTGAIERMGNKSNNDQSFFCPVFVLEDYMLEADTRFQFGYPSRLFLSNVIPDYAKNFEKFLLVKGKGAETFIKMLKHFDIEIHINEDVYIDFYKQINKLKKNNIFVKVYKDSLTVDKEIRTGTGNIYSIFTPFKKACWKSFLSEKVLPKANLKKIKFINDEDISKIPHKVEINKDTIWKSFSHSRNLEIANHKINIDYLLGKQEEYTLPYRNEEECLRHFKKYLKDDLINYKEDRDSLEKDLTSKMSLGLTWGLVSARTLKQEIIEFFDNDFFDIDWYKIPQKDLGPISFLSELIWREFYKYLFFHYPNLMNEEFQEKFRYKIEWVDNKNAVKRFEAWIKGETGYKIVDAAMMQLKKTGWMHNRSRMIVASVLTKNLGVDWRWGQEYFRAMLLDLDESSNNGGWQWGASVGADPKPIRIFNPYLQAENYDPKGIYQKKWLGEEKYFFDLPPIVDHKNARKEALRRYRLSDKGVRDY